MPPEESTAAHVVECFTGIRPTGDLTVANYIGAVKPIVELQAGGVRPMVFVADLHALTDNEPSVADAYIREVVADYLALGLDPDTTVIFPQSAIARQVYTLTGILARHATVAELLRVPTLKDKLKHHANPETANAALLLYPVMMAADILLQRSKSVPVGEDQVAHIEVARKLARRFNETYGDVFPVPRVQQVKSLRVLSLKGDGKMSKSSPEGALFLTEDPALAAKKIQRAQTALEGEMSDSLASCIVLAKGLSSDAGEHAEIDALVQRHLSGEQVMGAFKKLLGGIVERFLREFQQRRTAVTADPAFITGILDRGAREAARNADDTLALVQKAMHP